MANKIITYGSLFSGVGGFDLGFNNAGMKCEWRVEKDIYCRMVLKYHYIETEIFKDVNNVTGKNMKYHPLKKLAPEDVITAIELYETGSSLSDIGEMFGVSRQAMWDLLRRRIKFRNNLRFGEKNHFYRGGSSVDDNAQNKLEKAIEKGRIERPKQCECCKKTPPPMKNGNTGIQAHHSDYNKPFEVIWLCQKCHHKWHKENKAIKREKKEELAQVNLICGGFP